MTDKEHTLRTCSYFACNVGGDCPIVANPKYHPSDKDRIEIQEILKGFVEAGMIEPRFDEVDYETATTEILELIRDAKVAELRRLQAYGMNHQISSSILEARLNKLKELSHD